MNAIELLKNGDVNESLKRLQNEVRDNPSVPKHRVFLFQVYCILGDWKRALNQLNVLRDLDPSALPMIQTYQELLNCEALRGEVFSGNRTPMIFGEPEPWMAWMLEAQRFNAQGKAAEAKDLRDKALNESPAIPGTISLFPTGSDGDDSQSLHKHVPFEWIADADSRLGPILECIINGKYLWAPMARIHSIAFEKISDLRDLVWIPSRICWTNGGEVVAFVPTRYVGTETKTDDLLRLSRRTEWEVIGEETYAGFGQRVLTTDLDEYSLGEISKIDFHHES